MGSTLCSCCSESSSNPVNLKNFDKQIDSVFGSSNYDRALCDGLKQLFTKERLSTIPEEERDAFLSDWKTRGEDVHIIAEAELLSKIMGYQTRVSTGNRNFYEALKRQMSHKNQTRLMENCKIMLLEITDSIFVQLFSNFKEKWTSDVQRKRAREVREEFRKKLNAINEPWKMTEARDSILKLWKCDFIRKWSPRKDRDVRWECRDPADPLSIKHFRELVLDYIAADSNTPERFDAWSDIQLYDMAYFGMRNGGWSKYNSDYMDILRAIRKNDFEKSTLLEPHWAKYMESALERITKEQTIPFPGPINIRGGMS